MHIQQIPLGQFLENGVLFRTVKRYILPSSHVRFKNKGQWKVLIWRIFVNILNAPAGVHTLPKWASQCARTAEKLHYKIFFTIEWCIMRLFKVYISFTHLKFQICAIRNPIGAGQHIWAQYKQNKTWRKFAADVEGHE